MTDKGQIMINGVDVSGCSYYNPLGNYNCGGTKKCSQWSNCYFKQLARKTQECEELKEKLRELELKNTTLQNRNQQLDGSMAKSDHYRKALEEIEEYIYNNTDFDINDSIQSKTAGYDILQIIKDV